MRQDVYFEENPASGSAETHTVQADQHIFGFGMDGDCNMAKGEVQVVCKSVFEDTESCCSTARFTQKWIELINLMEKQKGNMTETRQ